MRVLRLLKKLVLVVLGLTVICAAVALTRELVIRWRETRLYPPPGRLVDVGGYRLHLNCTGSGRPVVVLDSGLGDSSLSWSLVQPDVAKFTSVCSFDRAGLGWSDPGPKPRTATQIAKELDLLLTKADVQAPYILVGHSLGGYDVRMYRSLHPGAVIGMVLVDSAHEDQPNRLHMLDALSQELESENRIERLTMIFGLPRLRHQCSYDPEHDPPQLQPIAGEIAAVGCRVSPLRTGSAEYGAIRESAREVSATGSLGSLPLIVLSHEPGSWEVPPELAKSADPPWAEMQEELARLSSRGRRIVAKGSGHYIQLYRPDVVIGAIHELVQDARANLQK